MYRRDTKGWLKHFDFMILDLLVLQLAFVLSYTVHHAWKNPYAEPLYANRLRPTPCRPQGRDAG